MTAFGRCLLPSQDAATPVMLSPSQPWQAVGVAEIYQKVGGRFHDLFFRDPRDFFVSVTHLPSMKVFACRKTQKD